MGFKDGRYKFGQQTIDVRGDKAYVADTQTLTGSVATMQSSISKFIKFSRCSVVEALEAASLHPAITMQIEDRKGTLNYGADADFVMLRSSDLGVMSTWIAGQCVFSVENQAETNRGIEKNVAVEKTTFDIGTKLIDSFKKI